VVDLQKIIEIMPPPPKPVQIVNEIQEFQKECTTTAYTYDERGDIQEMITTWLSSGSKKIINMQ
jgi:YD repeat-containing protein